MKILVFAIAAMFMFINNAANSASIYRSETGSDGVYEINIDGEIEPGDNEKFIKVFFEEPFGSYVRVVLNSPGGSIPEALQIASIVQDLMLGTKVKPKEVCGSACFFIWAAGWTRNAGHSYIVHTSGRVGLHRPYLRNPTTDRQSIQQQAALQNQVIKYLNEQLIPNRLIDLMMARPSNDVYWLTEQDLKELGKHPPSLEEIFINRCQYDRRKNELAIDLTIANRTYEAQQIEKQVDAAYDCILDLRADIRKKSVTAFYEKYRSKYGKQLTSPRKNTEQDEEESLVSRVHPGWRKVILTPQFATWKARQPLEIQKLAESTKAVDAIKMLDLFKAHIARSSEKK